MPYWWTSAAPKRSLRPPGDLSALRLIHGTPRIQATALSEMLDTDVGLRVQAGNPDLQSAQSSS